MADYLIQRYIPNVPNEHAGAWADVEVVRDLKAGEEDLALEQLAATHPGELTEASRVRVVRWDTTVEREVQPSAPEFVPATKGGP